MSTTLADELLNDFEDDDQDEQQERDGEAGEGEPAINGNGVEKDEGGLNGHVLPADEDAEDDHDEDMDDEDEDKAMLGTTEDQEDAKAKVEKMQLGSVKDVKSVAGLMSSVEPVLEQIGHFQSRPADERAFVGSIEENPEYHLLTQANTLSTSIDNEIILVHKFIRDHYSTRFPELERLVQNPLDYAKTVAIIGNGPLDKDSIKSLASQTNNLVNLPLNRVLDGPSLMVVTVEASTSRGQDLSAAELDRVLQACGMTLALDRAKKVLTDYVQSRMNIFAPNLTALIGSLTAAQLLNFAGGITGLAKTPACNLAPLGSKKQSQTGFATNVGINQQGFLYHSPLIRSIPSHLKRQAMRIVSAKIVLAARVDRVHQSPDGSTGESLRTDTLDRLDKLTEPPPNRGPRALPAPDDKPARKRGGRRARKAKEATAMTDLRREQNRLAFGKEEREVGYADSTKGMGMIGQNNDGRIRSLKVDPRTRAKLSKGTAARVGGGTATSFGTTTSIPTKGLPSGLRTSGVNEAAGTTSTIAFTPVQGLELADPNKRRQQQEKLDKAKGGWFGGGTFSQIPNSNSNSNSGSASTSGSGKGTGEFKVPALPGGAAGGKKASS